MLRNLRNWWEYFSAMGWRYVVFRLWYEVTLRSGLLAMRFPVRPTFRKWIELDDWRTSSPPFLIGDRSTFEIIPERSESLQFEAQRILGGEIQFFYGEWKQVNNQWLKNFDTGFQYDPKIHWTLIPDFSATIGDIKYVWEPSRFLFLQTILRYDLAFDKDHSEWVFSKIENWIDQNPINCGPNYRCSQEISIRLFNWIYALYFYQNSTELTNERFNKIIWSIYWQARHVRSNIHFSRIAVRNNHAITETLALYVVGTLFPFFAESSEWKKRGKSWFEQEILFQVFPDGGYLQYSFNYQRVVAQLLTLGLTLARKHGHPIASQVLDRAQQTVRLMLSCQDTESGQLPNYGANDGSLFFRWSDHPFSDYRPALDDLHRVLTGSGLYQNLSPNAWWGSVQLGSYGMQAVAISEGALTFPDAGLFVYRAQHMHAMIVCPQLKARPSQADHLHLDVWLNGENILIDGGAYRYNTEPKLKEYFFGTESHNTVMIAEYDQMKKGPRFVWLNWTKVTNAGWVGSNTFLAEIICFEQLGYVKHERRIEFTANTNIVIEDKVTGKGKLPMRQLWHKPVQKVIDASAVGEAGESIVVQSVDAKYSPTYGQLGPCTQFEFVTNGHRIRTHLIFK
jgi:hypothetical protein